MELIKLYFISKIATFWGWNNSNLEWKQLGKKITPAEGNSLLHFRSYFNSTLEVILTPF